jgi:hypothetical protein
MSEDYKGKSQLQRMRELAQAKPKFAGPIQLQGPEAQALLERDKKARVIWAEDECAPDSETIEQAYKRLTGYQGRLAALQWVDEGDCFLYDYGNGLLATVGPPKAGITALRLEEGKELPRYYPNADKLSAQGDLVKHVLEFLEWLESDSGAELVICKADHVRRTEVDFFPTELTHEELVQKFLGINREELEKERRHMLEVESSCNPIKF